jgi:tRNA(Ile)-lysidine synthase
LLICFLNLQKAEFFSTARYFAIFSCFSSLIAHFISHCHFFRGNGSNRSEIAQGTKRPIKGNSGLKRNGWNGLESFPMMISFIVVDNQYNKHMMNSNLLKTIENTIRRHDLLPFDALDSDDDASRPQERVPVVLMVSGGSDSVALARLLPLLCERANFTILHINHQLRGEAADGDERFVVELARELGLPCEVRRFDVAAAAAKTGANTEHVGRDIRYAAAHELLDELCAKQGIDPTEGRIATAHTLDDRAETFFMRAIVGAGAGALSSIPYRNGRVIRPLLDCSREQLRDWLVAQAPLPENFCHSKSQAKISEEKPPLPSSCDTSSNDNDTEKLKRELWREDATNEDTGKLRAFVRHELIPLAKTRNQDLLNTVAQSLDNLAQDDKLLTKLTEELEDRLLSEEAEGAIRISDELYKEDEALIKRMIHRASKKVLPPQERITAHHINKITAQGAQSGFAIDLPGAATVRNEYGALIFSPPKTKAPLPVDTSWSLTLQEGISEQLPDGRCITLSRVNPDEHKGDPVGYARAHAKTSQVFIDGEALASHGTADNKASLTISYLQPGDRFCPLGMGGRHKLVSDVLIDRKIPQEKRAHLMKLSLTIGGSRRCESTTPQGYSTPSLCHPEAKPKDLSASGVKDPSASPQDDRVEDALSQDAAAPSLASARPPSTTLTVATPTSPAGQTQEIVWIIDIQLDERFKVSDATTAMFSILVS